MEHDKSSVQGRLRLPLQILRLVVSDLQEDSEFAHSNNEFSLALRSLTDQLDKVMRYTDVLHSSGLPPAHEDAGKRANLTSRPEDAEEQVRSLSDTKEGDQLQKDRAHSPGGRRQSRAAKVPRQLPVLMLHPLGIRRAAWDMLIALLLVYICFSLPFVMGFGSEEGGFIVWFDTFVDVIFLMDCVLNFRTGFVRSDGTEVFDWKKVALRYMRSWFLLDLISSIPSDGPFGQLQPLKLLKGTRILKCFKILRLRKLRNCVSADMFEYVEEWLGSTSIGRNLNLLKLLMATLVLAHWMACFMAYSGDGFLSSYSGDLGDSRYEQYLAALYWAMTTITTVGYGDILPVTDFERLYAMAAMVIGGSFYGFVIGNISAVVTATSLNQNAVNHRLDMITEWCEHHQFEKALRRRILSYFRAYLSVTMSIDEQDIIKDLPSELKLEVGKCLVPDLVRYSPLFHDVPAGAIARLSPILHYMSFKGGEHIVVEGDVGVGMYFVEKGALTMQRSSGECAKPDLGPTDTFGEEVLLGIEDQYTYSVVSSAETCVFMLEEKDFHETFVTMPTVLKLVRSNFESADDRHSYALPPSESFESKVLAIVRHLEDKAHEDRLHAWAIRDACSTIHEEVRKANTSGGGSDSPTVQLNKTILPKGSSVVGDACVPHPMLGAPSADVLAFPAVSRPAAQQCNWTPCTSGGNELRKPCSVEERMTSQAEGTERVHTDFFL